MLTLKNYLEWSPLNFITFSLKCSECNYGAVIFRYYLFKREPALLSQQKLSSSFSVGCLQGVFKTHSTQNTITFRLPQLQTPWYTPNKSSWAIPTDCNTAVISDAEINNSDPGKLCPMGGQGAVNLIKRHTH